jgi:hypothetical protein
MLLYRSFGPAGQQALVSNLLAFSPYNGANRLAPSDIEPLREISRGFLARKWTLVQDRRDWTKVQLVADP